MRDFCERRECNSTCPLWEVDHCSDICTEIYKNGYDIVKIKEDKPKKKTLLNEGEETNE